MSRRLGSVLLVLIFTGFLLVVGALHYYRCESSVKYLKTTGVVIIDGLTLTYIDNDTVRTTREQNYLLQLRNEYHIIILNKE